MKQGFTLFLLLFSALTASTAVLAEEPSTATTAPYLLAGAPTFDLSISQFRENFNTQNPKLILNEFRAIDSSRDRANLTRAASKINENLYASSALERGTLKIKSMQITWLPIQGPEQKAAKAKALESKGLWRRAATAYTSIMGMTSTSNELWGIARLRNRCLRNAQRC